MKTINFPLRGATIILALFFACHFIANANIRNPLPPMHVDNTKDDVPSLNVANIRNPLPPMHGSPTKLEGFQI